MKIIKREKQPAYYLTTHPFAARTAAQIYNYPLTAIQIKSLYNNGGSVRYGPTTGSP